MPKHITDAEDVLRFIVLFMTDNGHSPTVREITEGVGLHSTSAAYHWMEVLRKDNRIDWTPGLARTIKIMEDA
jgi:SOS-response transcriptional repressor LexA